MLKIPADRVKKLDKLFSSYELLAEGTYVYLCDLEYDYSRWSREAVHKFSMSGEYIFNAGDEWASHIHPDDRDEYIEDIRKIFSGEKDTHDLQYRAGNGSGVYNTLTCKGQIIRDDNGEPAYFVGFMRNNDERTMVDSVTGFGSQFAFMEDLETSLTEMEDIVIVMIGISRFSDINTSYGYDFGNVILQKFARFISEHASDVSSRFYRLDGTKMAIIIDGCTVEQAEGSYKKLQEMMKTGFKVLERRIPISTSAAMIGITDFDVSVKTVMSCLSYAYGISKRERNGDLVVFENKVSDETIYKLDLINDIQKSIIDGCEGFELYYQPVMDAHSERLIGAEALIRWRNDKYGFVMPNDFIPIIEVDPLFIVLGEWILRRAMHDMKIFVDRDPSFVVNVNLSYSQMEKTDFIEDVRGIIDEQEFPATNLCLEITERCRILSMNRLEKIVSVLRDIGVKFALDDFGTGFSSASVIKEIPLDTIKIDRGFVLHVDKDRNEQELVGAFSSMASIYGSEVCVEGIETDEMRLALLGYPISSVQGYLYSKPIPIEQFTAKYLPVE